MTTFTYFAYGSNMLLGRLQGRCPSARFTGVAFVHGYVMAFDKRSIDGSGKATIIEDDDGAALYGALFEIDAGECNCLTNAEGPGYEIKDDFAVKRLDNNEELTVTTYIAKEEEREPSLTPYDWYKQLVMAGALQAGLPKEYIRRLEQISDIPDTCESRKTRIEALAALGKVDE